MVGILQIFELIYSPGNWILYVHFFQEDLDAGCASLGIEIVFFFMTNNLKNNLLCDGTYIESRLGERKEKWVRGSEGNLKGQSFLLTYLVNLMRELSVAIPGMEGGMLGITLEALFSLER